MGLFINDQAYDAPYINGERMETAYINGRNIWPLFPADAFVIRFVDPDTGIGIRDQLPRHGMLTAPILSTKNRTGYGLHLRAERK
jgi:hypothetical protein